MRIDSPIARASMRIISPPSLPLVNPRFSSQPNDLNQQAAELGGNMVRTRDRSELTWLVPEPRLDWTYRVDWDWVGR